MNNFSSNNLDIYTQAPPVETEMGERVSSLGMLVG